MPTWLITKHMEFAAVNLHEIESLSLSKCLRGYYFNLAFEDVATV